MKYAGRVTFCPFDPRWVQPTRLPPLDMGIVPDISYRKPAAASVFCGHDSL